MVEHRSEKPGVDSSILSLGISFFDLKPIKNPPKSGVFVYFVKALTNELRTYWRANFRRALESPAEA